MAVLAQKEVVEEVHIGRMAVLLADATPSERTVQAHGEPVSRNEEKRYMSALLSCVSRHNGTTARTVGKSITACFDEAVEAIKAAINMQMIAGDARVDADYPYAIQIAIDYGFGPVRKDLAGSVGDTVNRLTKMLISGEILVSDAVRTDAEFDGVQYHRAALRDSDLPSSFLVYKTVWDADRDYSPGQAAAGLRFVHGAALCGGRLAPCFYCGGRLHPATDCPSKAMPEMTRGLFDLGRFTMSETNEAFREYAEGGLAIDPAPSGDGEDAKTNPALTAHLGFYELRRVFQLRFLNAIWDPPESHRHSWQKIAAGTTLPVTGGGLWLAYDCLRTSRLDQAEELLKIAEESNPKDFRLHCLAGFLRAERGALQSAGDHFAKAYEYARTNPQKIYTLLLRYRALSLDGKNRQAEEMLRTCLRLDRACPDAVFEDVIAKFRSESPRDALPQLVDLIGRNREYWVAAMISPDLAPRQDLIAPEMDGLLKQARKEGSALTVEAEAQLERLKQVIDGDDGEVKTLQDRYDNLKLLADADTFLVWRDVWNRAALLIAACGRTEHDRRGEVENTLAKLQNRLSCCMKSRHFRDAKVQSLARLVRDGIHQAESDIYAPEPYKAILSRCAELSRRIDTMEKVIEDREWRERFTARIKVFFRSLLLFLGIAAAVEVGVIHVVLNYLLPGADGPGSSPVSGMGWASDALVGATIAASVLYAGFRAIPKDKDKAR